VGRGAHDLDPLAARQGAADLGSAGRRAHPRWRAARS
jgi:hypothetical protein